MSSPQPVSIRPPKLEEVKKEENPYSALLHKQREAFNTQGVPSIERRIESLNTLGKAISNQSEEIIAAVQADFGHRSSVETIASEVLGVLGEIKATKGKIKKWAKPVKPALGGLPGGRMIFQPKGVIGIMGAWNYPVQLVMSPLIGVLSAGNHAMIKPPDVTPRTSEIIQSLIEANFDESYIAVVTGDVQSAIHFSELPFDHLVYTGNTEIGRRVMMAAAKNLTPVTLEMGGKSPVIIHDSFPVDKAIKRLIPGKSMNAGQTCIAPDYVLINENRVPEFVESFKQAATKRYPTIADNENITWIVNERHHKRLLDIIDDAKEKGAEVTQVNPKQEDLPEGSRVIPLTVISNVTDDMRCMQEELFGPVLPVKGTQSANEALTYVKDRPRPLALYYFDTDKQRSEQVMNSTISGGACVNDAMLHIANLNMPFGGTGESGLGHYHGYDGFLEFSHKKSIQFSSPRFSPSHFLAGPYPKRAYGLLRRVVRFLG